MLIYRLSLAPLGRGCPLQLFHHQYSLPRFPAGRLLLLPSLVSLASTSLDPSACNSDPALSFVQDRWGRQRGGRKARWDKLDRQPSALKSRLRLVNSAAAGRGVDDQARLDAVEEAFAFVDAASISAVVAAAAGAGVTSAGSGVGVGISGGARAGGSPGAELGHAGAAGAVGIFSDEGDGVDGDAVAEGGGVHSLPPGRLAQRQEGSDLPPTSPTPATGDGSVEDDVFGAPVKPAAAVAAATALSTPAAPKTPSSTGLRSSIHSSGSSSRTKTSGGGAGRRGSLRSPGGLSRAESVSGGGGLGSGSYRGSPPPLHRRLSSPAGTGSAKKSQKQRQVGASGLGSAKKKKQASARSGSGRHEREAEDQEEVDAATPPPPPSLFESVFKDKLPSLTPRKAPPATPR